MLAVFLALIRNKFYKLAFRAYLFSFPRLPRIRLFSVDLFRLYMFFKLLCFGFPVPWFVAFSDVWLGSRFWLHVFPR